MTSAITTRYVQEILVERPELFNASKKQETAWDEIGRLFHVWCDYDLTTACHVYRDHPDLIEGWDNMNTALIEGKGFNEDKTAVEFKFKGESYVLQNVRREADTGTEIKAGLFYNSGAELEPICIGKLDLCSLAVKAWENKSDDLAQVELTVPLGNGSEYSLSFYAREIEIKARFSNNAKSVIIGKCVFTRCRNVIDIFECNSEKFMGTITRAVFENFIDGAKRVCGKETDERNPLEEKQKLQEIDAILDIYADFRSESNAEALLTGVPKSQADQIRSSRHKAIMCHLINNQKQWKKLMEIFPSNSGGARMLSELRSVEYQRICDDKSIASQAAAKEKYDQASKTVKELYEAFSELRVILSSPSDAIETSNFL